MHRITVNNIYHSFFFIGYYLLKGKLSLNPFPICHPLIWFYDSITGINLFRPIYHRTHSTCWALGYIFKWLKGECLWSLPTLVFLGVVSKSWFTYMRPYAVICTYTACVTRSISHRLQKLIHYPYPCKFRSCIRRRCKCS